MACQPLRPTTVASIARPNEPRHKLPNLKLSFVKPDAAYFSDATACRRDVSRFVGVNDSPEVLF